MRLTLTRHSFLPEGVFGSLELPGGLELHTLEHSYGNRPKVKAGVYQCVRGPHQLSHGGPFETFEVKGVAGHTGILFHVGNTQADSSGCILLGMEEKGDALVKSRLAFNVFMASVSGLDQFELEVIDA
jgi:hypothetical protein